MSAKLDYIAKVQIAARHIIHDQITEFRNAKKWGHVAHTGENEFRHLLTSFLAANMLLDTDSVKIKYVDSEQYGRKIPTFEDEQLKEDWYLFHKDNAKLELQTAKKNLSQKKSPTLRRRIQENKERTTSSSGDDNKIVTGVSICMKCKVKEVKSPPYKICYTCNASTTHTKCESCGLFKAKMGFVKCYTCSYLKK